MLVFQAKLRHPEPWPPRPWTWAVLLADNTDKEAVDALRSLTTLRCQHGHFANQNTMDGPMLKWLLEWSAGQKQGEIQGERRGKGRFFPPTQWTEKNVGSTGWGADTWAMDGDEDEEERAGKRKRKGGWDADEDWY